MSQIITPRVGDVVPNPYNLREDWTVVKVEGRDITIRWADGSETLGSADGIIQHAYAQRELAAEYRAALASLAWSRSGSLKWEPGSLPTVELEQILMDVLADLWRDAYRRENEGERYRIFRRQVETALYCVTGESLWITRNYGERG